MVAPGQLPPSAYGPADILRHYDNFDVSVGRYQFIIRELKPKSKILEVGCFLGRYCDHFQKLGHEATGVDISPQVIEEASKLFPNMKFHCTQDKKLTDIFPLNSFDAVVASEVIEHVLHPQDFLGEIRGILKPGGRLLLTTQNSNALQYRLRMLLGRFFWDKTHLRLYNKAELREEICSAGFAIEKMKGIAINPKGPQCLARQVAYYSTYLNENFCWTWGVVATKSPRA